MVNCVIHRLDDGRYFCPLCVRYADSAAQRKCLVAEYPKPPSLAHQAWNLARSLADFVADGCKTVGPEEYAARLAICEACVPPDGYRRGNWCKHCGCKLSLKARGRAFRCPIGKWPPIAP